MRIIRPANPTEIILTGCCGITSRQPRDKRIAVQPVKRQFYAVSGGDGRVNIILHRVVIALSGSRNQIHRTLFRHARLCCHRNGSAGFDRNRRGACRVNLPIPAEIRLIVAKSIAECFEGGDFMSLLPALQEFFSGLLSKPGDKFSAEITPTGKQVVKIDTEDIKRSAVRYPSTGTVVETIVHKPKDE